ncbi:MAG: inositol monophosphatase family protein [Candidatus Krumholzibacteriia bacterium]
MIEPAAASELRAALEPIVRRAGDHLLDSFENLRAGDVGRKGIVDLVTRLDLEAQALVQEGLKSAFPGEEVLAEEGCGDAPAQAGRRHQSLWLVDPLDGTTNFAHGLPVFAVSVARVRGLQLEAGMVYAPYLRELYWAASGCGARLHGRRLRVSSRAELDDALLATGFPYDIRSNHHNNLREWTHMAVRCRGLRRCGAAALDLAWLAAGRFDGYWEFRLNPWDLAAGALLVQEAGGRLTDPGGGSEYLWSGDVVATNGILHERLLNELRLARLE